MSIDDAWRYGTAAWGWLGANPYVMMVAGGLLFITGVYYALRPAPSESDGSKQQAPQTTPLVQGPLFDWDGKERIVFRGRYQRGGRDLNAYVTYGQFGGIGPQQVLAGATAIEPRIKIDEIGRFDRDQETRIEIGSVTNVDGNQQVIQWGKTELNNKKVGITWGSYFGCLILVSSDGGESRFPFAIISRSVENKPAPPILIGPPLLPGCMAGL